MTVRSSRCCRKDPKLSHLKRQHGKGKRAVLWCFAELLSFVVHLWFFTTQRCEVKEKKTTKKKKNKKSCTRVGTRTTSTSVEIKHAKMCCWRVCEACRSGLRRQREVCFETKLSLKLCAKLLLVRWCNRRPLPSKSKPTLTAAWRKLVPHVAWAIMFLEVANPIKDHFLYAYCTDLFNLQVSCRKWTISTLIFLSCRKPLIQRGKIIYQRQIEWTCFHALINWN